LAANRSPETLSTVLKRSRNQSIAMIRAYMPVIGTFTESAIMTIRTRDELGTGVAPMDARFDNTRMMMYCTAESLMPCVAARKVTAIGK